MASVVLAQTVTDTLQASGLRKVRFRYTLDNGSVLDVGPIHAAGDADINALRSAKGDELLVTLAAIEINEALNGD